MNYCIYFFAADTCDLIESWRTNLSLADSALQKARNSGRLEPSEEDGLSRRIGEGLAGNWPQPADMPAFDALLWLLDVSSERIPMQYCSEFRHFSFLEEVGLWPTFLAFPCPLPLPQSAGEFPAVGWLPAHAMPKLLSEAGSMPEPHDPFPRAARRELLEVIESVCEDQLDLFAIVG